MLSSAARTEGIAGKRPSSAAKTVKIAGKRPSSAAKTVKIAGKGQVPPLKPKNSDIKAITAFQML